MLSEASFEPVTAPASSAAVLRVRGLSKRYGQNWALSPVDLDFLAGNVHVLFGENGAGKSTLISMLAGANAPSGGEFEIDGHRGAFESVAAARKHGVRAVFQEFSLVPFLTVAENILLGEEPVRGMGILDKNKAFDEAARLVSELGFHLDIHARVSTLPRGKQQMVEICKALRDMPRVLILDEPTASLSEHDAQALFGLVRQLKAHGTAVIYITHRMYEIPVLGDQVSVLRDGKLVATVPAQTPERRLIELMTGRKLENIYPKLYDKIGDVRLELECVTFARQEDSETPRSVNLKVRAGEIVGVAGLVGCGKSEMAQACFGLHRLTSGSIRIDGKSVHLRHPADAIQNGLWYSPADRKVDGLALDLTAGFNMSLSGLRWGAARGWWLALRREGRLLRNSAQRVGFPISRLSESVAEFSGGNQQKVLLAKALSQPIGVYVLDEPTVGVDVGARESIYKCLVELSAAGAAVLLVSSDLPELLGMTHRMVVMNNGQIASEFQRDEYDEHRILEQFF
ncbi:hypothetical protein B0E49_16540 [Polaromonas sp. C04]|nr:hypothetical protein B0E49_16540 [Polaromonas sp. C04]